MNFGEGRILIPTTILLIGSIQAVLVSIAHSGSGNTAMLRTQEEIWWASCDYIVCQWAKEMLLISTVYKMSLKMWEVKSWQTYCSCVRLTRRRSHCRHHTTTFWKCTCYYHRWTRQQNRYQLVGTGSCLHRNRHHNRPCHHNARVTGCNACCCM